MQNLNTSQLLASIHDEPNIWSYQNLPSRPSVITITIPSTPSQSPHVENNVRQGTPNLNDVDIVTVNSPAHMFTQSLRNQIDALLPASLRVYDRTIFDVGLLFEARSTTLFSRLGNGTVDVEQYPVSGLSIPVDALDGDVVNSALLLPKLAELVLRAPRAAGTDPDNSTVTNSVSPNTNDTTVIHFLSTLSTSLHLVTLTLTSSTAILPILTALRDHHPTLTRLALRLSSSSYTSQADMARISNEVLQGLKDFKQLEHIMIENTIFEGNQALNTALGALPSLSHIDIKTSEFMKNEEGIS